MLVCPMVVIGYYNAHGYLTSLPNTPPPCNGFEVHRYSKSIGTTAPRVMTLHRPYSQLDFVVTYCNPLVLQSTLSLTSPKPHQSATLVQVTISSAFDA